MPDTLFGYILYFDGCVTRCLSEHNTPGKVWDYILEARASKQPVVRFWTPPQAGKYSEILVDAVRVIAIRTNEDEISISQPNLEEQRKADIRRQEARHSLQGGGRASMGQVAAPHGAGKKR
jgi:hypothetical protein